RLWVREIEIGCFSAPELCDVRAAFVFAVADETAETLHLCESRMVKQHRGLHIRDKAHARVFELPGERSGIGKAGAVPGEDIAVFVAPGIARREVEGPAWDAMLLKAREKSRELLLGIAGFGVLHRGAGIAEAPSRRECGSSCQRGELCDDIAHLPAEHEIEIEIAIACFETAVRPMIGVDFLAEIESAVREIVVEEPHGRRAVRGPDRDVKGDVFVKRVRGFRIVAKCIGRTHSKAAAMLVGVAALLPEAVIMISRVADEIVDKTRPRTLEAVSISRSIPQHGLKSLCFVRAEGPGQGQRRAPNRQSYKLSLDCD